MTEFRSSSYAQEVIFGAGALDQLGETAAQFGWQRLLLCTSGSQRSSGHASRAEAALGARLAASYDGVRPHVQEEQVNEAVALSRQHNVDAVIALGGGSTIGIAKAVSDALEAEHADQAAGPASPIEQPRVPAIAIPTTYAGSEMTPIYGVTRMVDGAPRKITVTRPKVVPKLVIYDPRLTLDLPSGLTATSAVNALAHCFESLYSPAPNSLASAAALGGLRAIGSALPRVHADGGDLDARTDLLEGAYLAGCALARVPMALHHGTCHVLGGSAGVPHGVANAIVLPHALRYNREVAAPQLAQAALALGVASASDDDLAATDAAIDWVDNLLDTLGLQRRLRDVGVAESDIAHLARVALENHTVQSNPRPIDSLSALEDFLEAMW